MNLLFVYTQNRWHSLTAEKIFSDIPGVSVISAGTATNAHRKVTASTIACADQESVGNYPT